MGKAHLFILVTDYYIEPKPLIFIHDFQLWLHSSLANIEFEVIATASE